MTSKRSDAQSNLFHLWRDIIADELGYTKKEMKKVLIRTHCTPTQVTDLNGVVSQDWPSTADMKVKEFSQLLNIVDTEFNVRIVDKIYSKEQIYHGNKLYLMPDLMIKPSAGYLFF